MPSRAEEAQELARKVLLAPLGNRWAHVQGVAGAVELGPVTQSAEERHQLLVAAWLHDLGYPPTCG